MRQPISRNGLWLAGGYLLVVFLAIATIFLPGSGSLSGVYALILTLPLSWFISSIVDTINPSILDIPFVGPAAMMICGMINALLVYGIIARKRKS